jgi:hypothetical protein
MHAPQLKKWTAIIDHQCGIRRLACNPDLNLALIAFRLLNCLLIVRYPQKHHHGTRDGHHASIRREAHAHARRQRISLAQIMAEGLCVSHEAR